MAVDLSFLPDQPGTRKKREDLAFLPDQPEEKPDLSFLPDQPSGGPEEGIPPGAAPEGPQKSIISRTAAGVADIVRKVAGMTPKPPVNIPGAIQDQFNRARQAVPESMEPKDILAALKDNPVIQNLGKIQDVERTYPGYKGTRPLAEDADYIRNFLADYVSSLTPSDIIKGTRAPGRQPVTEASIMDEAGRTGKVPYGDIAKRTVSEMISSGIPITPTEIGLAYGITAAMKPITQGLVQAFPNLSRDILKHTVRTPIRDIPLIRKKAAEAGEAAYLKGASREEAERVVIGVYEKESKTALNRAISDMELELDAARVKPTTLPSTDVKGGIPVTEGQVDRPFVRALKSHLERLKKSAGELGKRMDEGGTVLDVEGTTVPGGKPTLPVPPEGTGAGPTNLFEPQQGISPSRPQIPGPGGKLLSGPEPSPISEIAQKLPVEGLTNKFFPLEKGPYSESIARNPVFIKNLRDAGSVIEKYDRLDGVATTPDSLARVFGKLHGNEDAAAANEPKLSRAERKAAAERLAKVYPEYAQEIGPLAQMIKIRQMMLGDAYEKAATPSKRVLDVIREIPTVLRPKAAIEVERATPAPGEAGPAIPPAKTPATPAATPARPTSSISPQTIGEKGAKYTLSKFPALVKAVAGKTFPVPKDVLNQVLKEAATAGEEGLLRHGDAAKANEEALGAFVQCLKAKAAKIGSLAPAQGGRRAPGQPMKTAGPTVQPPAGGAIQRPPSSPVGSRVRLKSMGPRTYKVIKELPREPGDLKDERFFSVQDEKTGKTETVEMGDIVRMKPRPAGGGDAAASKGSIPLGQYEKLGGETPTGQPPFKLFERVRAMVKKFHVRVGERYVPRGAEGVFYMKTENVRLRALNKVAVAVHEVGHAIDKKHGITPAVLRREGPAADLLRKQLTDVYVEYYTTGKADHPPRKRIMEGLSTLVQKMTETPSEIKAKYPELVQAFLTPGGAFYSKDYADLLADAHAIVQEYQALDPLARVGSRVTSTFQQREVRDSYLNLWDKFVTEIVDNIHPIVKMAREAGVERTAADPSLWMRQYRQSSGMIVNNLSGNKGFWIPGAGGSFKKVSDKTIGQFLQDLQKKGIREEFAHWLVARRQHFSYMELDRLTQEVDRLTVAVEDGTAGEADKNALSEMENSRLKLSETLKRDGFDRLDVDDAYEEYKEVFADEAKTFDNFTRANLDVLRDTGNQLTQDQYDEMVKNEGYASFKRDVYDELLGSEAGTPPVMQVGRTKVSSMMGRHGSELTIINPLYSLVRDHAEIMRKAMRQNVYNRLADIAEKFPDIFQKQDLHAVPNPQTGRMLFPQEKDQNIIMARDRDGVRIPLLVSEEIKKVVDDVLDMGNMHIFEKTMLRANRIFSKGTTGAYPMFAFTNYSMDQVAAAANTRNRYTPIYDTLAHVMKGLLAHGSKEAGYLREYLILGGERQTLSGWQDMDIKELFERLDGEKKGLDRVIGWIDKGFDVMSIPGKWSEIITRGAEYIKSRKAGNPELVALEDAGRVSAPFHHMGRWGGQVGRTLVKSVPFFNPAIQGISQYFRSVGNKDTRSRALFVTAALIAAMVGGSSSVLLFGSEEQKKQLADLEGDLLTNYIWFPHPDGRRLLRVRVPSEIGVGGALINMAILDAFGGANYGPKDYAIAATAWVPDQFNPTDFGRMFFSLMPQLIKPWMEVLTNTQTFPRIRPLEGAAVRSREPGQRYMETTSGMAKWLGEKLNLSPIAIDHLIEGYMGRASRFLTGRHKTMNPFVQDWYFTSGRNLREYYETREETRQIMKSFKTGDHPLTVEQKDALRGRLGLIKRVEARLDRLRQVQKSGGTSADVFDERRAILDDISTLGILSDMVNLKRRKR